MSWQVSIPWVACSPRAGADDKVGRLEVALSQLPMALRPQESPSDEDWPPPFDLHRSRTDSRCCPSEPERVAGHFSRRSAGPEAVLRSLPKARAEPAFVIQMAAQPVEKLPDGGDWLYELKLDGSSYSVVVISSRRVEIGVTSRKGAAWHYCIEILKRLVKS
jgi:ATP-dependent DNA ligase